MHVTMAALCTAHFIRCLALVGRGTLVFRLFIPRLDQQTPSNILSLGVAVFLYRLDLGAGGDCLGYSQLSITR